MPFGVKMPKVPGFARSSPGLVPTDVSTGGVHPFVRESMLPRMKMNKSVNPKQRAAIYEAMKKRGQL